MEADQWTLKAKKNYQRKGLLSRNLPIDLRLKYIEC